MTESAVVPSRFSRWKYNLHNSMIPYEVKVYAYAHGYQSFLPFEKADDGVARVLRRSAVMPPEKLFPRTLLVE